MRFRPLHDRVVVRRLEEEERTSDGIIIPDTAKEKPMEGMMIPPEVRFSPSSTTRFVMLPIRSPPASLGA